MEKHEINVDTMFGEPVIADIEHQPLDSEHLQVTIFINRIPKLFYGFPGVKKLLQTPIVRPIRRDFIRSWGERLLRWADEPVTATAGETADD